MKVMYKRRKRKSQNRKKVLNKNQLYIASAHELSKEEIEHIKLIFNNKYQDVKTEVRPELIGGILIQLGDKLFDGTISGQLQNLKKKIYNTRLNA